MLGLAMVTTALAVTWAFYPWPLGFALYHGYLPLHGRITGHDSELPGVAARCVNCHDAVRSDVAPAIVIAPLTKASLAEPVSRRGGPPTVYAENSFCSLLRDGVDPALVIVNRTMPRFEITQSNCHALWRYVNSR
jgi:hypothetical protein